MEKTRKRLWSLLLALCVLLSAFPVIRTEAAKAVRYA